MRTNSYGKVALRKGAGTTTQSASRNLNLFEIVQTCLSKIKSNAGATAAGLVIAGGGVANASITSTSTPRPSRRRVRRALQAAAAWGTALAMIAMIGLVLVPGVASAATPNSTSSMGPLSLTATRWSNGNGTFTDCGKSTLGGGPVVCTTYASRAKTAELAAEAKRGASMDAAMLRMVQNACGAGIDYLASKVKLPSGRGIPGGGFTGEVVGPEICTHVFRPSGPNTALLHAAAHHACYQWSNRRPDAETNAKGWCFDK